MRRLRLVRHAVSLAVVLGGAWVAWTQSQPPVTPSKINKVAEDLYELETAGGGLVSNGGNVAIYLTGEGVIVVDDKFDANFPDIMAAVKSLTDKPVRYVISTHHHGDHTGSNARFLALNAQIIGQKNNRANMEKNKLPGLPQITFTDEAEVHLGGKEVRTRYYGRGHTNGDAVVYFPALKVVHTGDLFVNFAPLIDYANGGSIVEWPKTLDGILGLDFETAIPGHGPIMKKDDVRKFREKLATMQTRVSEMTRAGSPDEAINQVLVSDFGFQPNTPQIRFTPDLIAEIRAAGR
jgi:glyoxylase-like metal-dependent hydrolase (beta-lactamase superfamily II)